MYKKQPADVNLLKPGDIWAQDDNQTNAIPGTGMYQAQKQDPSKTTQAAIKSTRMVTIPRTIKQSD